MLVAKTKANAPQDSERSASVAGSSKRRVEKSGRKKTVLIGGHFPPIIAQELGILAAEERATKQELLAEALDLLFDKKGKRRIRDLIL